MRGLVLAQWPTTIVDRSAAAARNPRFICKEGRFGQIKKAASECWVGKLRNHGL